MRTATWTFIILGAAMSCAPADGSWKQLSPEELLALGEALDEAHEADPAGSAAELAICLERAAGWLGSGEADATMCREIYTARMGGDHVLANCLRGVAHVSSSEDLAVLREACRANPEAEIQRRAYADCLDEAEESRFDRGRSIEDILRGADVEEIEERRALCGEAREWKMRADSIRDARSPNKSDS